MTAGASDGSSASSAARTAAENRCGACTTTSTMKVRPPRRSCVRCRSRSAMACSTSRTVSARTPPRRCSTRSTVASLRPAWAAISRTLYAWATPTDPEAFLRSLQGFPEAIAAVRSGQPPPPGRTCRHDPAEPRHAGPLLVPAGGLPPGRLPGRGRADHRPGRLPVRGLRRAGRAGLRVAAARARRHRRSAAEVQAELARALLDGPGIVVFRGRVPGPGRRRPGHRGLRRDDRRAAGRRRASPATTSPSRAPTTGSGARWRSSRCGRPEVFADYYANDMLALVCEAWLGPGYQVTSQVNVVNPGGAGAGRAPRLPPRLHVADQSLAYPAHVHRLSPVLTLQGAVAHCDMPVETGPTMYLPHSQKYEPGYLAFHQPEFTALLRRAPRPAAAAPRATRRSSTRRCSTAPAPTAPRTSGGWPTCCRSPPRSAGRWRASTGPR